jgi:hypothetical protein
VIVSRRIEPMTKVCWMILVKDVSAILLTDSDRLDWKTATWLFRPTVEKLHSLPKPKPKKGSSAPKPETPAEGEAQEAPSAAEAESRAEGEARKGIVYVPEEAPVLMCLEFGTTASAAADYPIPGWTGPGCDCPCCPDGCTPCHCGPCHYRSFSYKALM